MRILPTMPTSASQGTEPRVAAQRVTVWVGRVAWAALALAAGPTLGAAMRDWDAAVRTTATVGLWAVWAAVLVATLVPHHIALTVWRVAAPAAAAAVALAAIGGHASILAAVVAVVALAAAFTPAVGAACINGPAYPNERRFPLRPPAVAMVGPALVAWVMVVGAPTAAVLLLAARRWGVGIAVAVVGGAAAVLGARALHGLSRRWFVVVPAGVVLHDPLALADPVLLQRPLVAGIGPAPQSGDRLDLTGGSRGLALELRLTDPTGMLVRDRPGRRPTAGTITAQRVLLTPTRPAAVLEELAERGYHIG